MAEEFSRDLAVLLKVIVVFNKTKMNLKDKFDLIKNHYFELNTFVRKIANWQVVIVDENFGVRITSILG